MFTCNKIAKSVYPKQDRILVIGDLHEIYAQELFKKLKLTIILIIG